MKFRLRAVVWGRGGKGVISQRVLSWCVCFARFCESSVY